MNKVILIGRLCADPERKEFESGAVKAGFTLAVDRPRKDQNGEKVTDFINCAAWQHNANFLLNYAHKGDKIAVSGELQTRKYTDKDGNNRVICEIMVERAEIAQSKRGDFTEVQDADNPFPESLT